MHKFNSWAWHFLNQHSYTSLASFRIHVGALTIFNLFSGLTHFSTTRDVKAQGNYSDQFTKLYCIDNSYTSQFSVTPVKGQHITTSLPFNSIMMTGWLVLLNPLSNIPKLIQKLTEFQVILLSLRKCFNRNYVWGFKNSTFWLKKILAVASIQLEILKINKHKRKQNKTKNLLGYDRLADFFDPY